MTCHIFLHLEVQGHTAPHFKAIRRGKNEVIGLSCGNTSSIFQDIMKSECLLHKWGLVDSQFGTTVCHNLDIDSTSF